MDIVSMMLRDGANESMRLEGRRGWAISAVRTVYAPNVAVLAISSLVFAGAILTALSEQRWVLSQCSARATILGIP